jgi:hypothetical protein
VRLARHQRRRKALRRQRCTARLIGDCDRHCEYNDAQPDRFSNGRRGRDVCYARTIANAHHVSQAFMQSPCARLVRIIKSSQVNTLPKAKSQAKDKRAKDRQKYSALRCKVGMAPPGFEVRRRMNRVAFHVPNYTAQALRAESAAYATLARSSTRFT